MSGTDLSKKEKRAPAEFVQARPTDGNADKPEKKSEPGAGHAEVAAQVNGDEKPDAEDERHPMEVTQPLAEQQGTEPAGR